MDFKKAIAVAEENARQFVPDAREFTLEGAIVSGNDYEITLSYYLDGKIPAELSEGIDEKSSLLKLASLMRSRKEYKIFMVDKDDFSFKGFKSHG